jgi:hypothetical protein
MESSGEFVCFVSTEPLDAFFLLFGLCCYCLVPFNCQGGPYHGIEVYPRVVKMKLYMVSREVCNIL